MNKYPSRTSTPKSGAQHQAPIYQENPQRVARLEKEVQELKYQVDEKDRLLKLIRDENNQLRTTTQTDIEQLKKQDQEYRQKIKEMENRLRDMETLKVECTKVKEENS